MKLRFMAMGALGALLVVLAGCGGGGAPDLSSVAQAAEKTQGAGTAKFELSFRAQGAGTFTAGGAVDYAKRRSRMTLDLGSLGGLFGQAGQQPADTSLDLITDGKVVYLRFPMLAAIVGKGKPWLELDLEQLASQSGVDLGQLGQIDQGDPTQALAYLRAAGDFTEVGKEEVRGVQTTRYKGTVDLSKALDRLSGPQRDQLQQLLDRSGVTTLPAEAWIDAEGYLRKLTMSFARAGSMPGGALDLSMELYDFGSDVGIELPPAEQVTNITELAAKGGLGS